MKKIALLTALSFIVSISFAQVQRKAKPSSTADSTMAPKENNAQEGRGDKMKMMKELDLTKEQRGKLKEVRQATKAKKDAIDSDGSLKPEEKEAKLKELRKEQQKNTMSILTPEQKAKLMKMRRDNKDQKMEEIDNK